MACEKGAKGLGRVRPRPSHAEMGCRTLLDGLNGDVRPAPPAIALQDVRVEHVGYAAGTHAKHARGLRRRNGLAPHDIRGIKLATIVIYSNTQANPTLPILVVALPVGAGFFLRAKRASGPVSPLELLPRAAKLPGQRSAAILATVRLRHRQANLARYADKNADEVYLDLRHGARATGHGPRATSYELRVTISVHESENRPLVTSIIRVEHWHVRNLCTLARQRCAQGGHTAQRNQVPKMRARPTRGTTPTRSNYSR